MKKSTINFHIELDDKNIPEKISWEASDLNEPLQETKTVSISLWDHNTKNSLRMDLWTKDMPLDEMKKFYIDCVGGLAQSILNATGDEYMSTELNKTCEVLAEHLNKELKGMKKD